MFKNYLNIAVRNLLRHKGYSFINITGLAIGIACCLLIVLYVQDELSYDRFHEKADRIYRVTLHGRLAGNDIHAATSSAPMAATLMDDYPEVLVATRVRRSSLMLVSREDQYFNEKRVFYADSTLFSVFTLPLIAGDPNTALREPHTMVLTEATAQKYFGDEDPIGKTLRFNNDADYRITGIAENVPSNSHFHFDFLASFATLQDSRSPVWINNSMQTYLVLQENYPPARLEAKFPDLIRKYIGPQVQQALGVTIDEFLAAGGRYDFALQPLTDIHLYSHLEGEIEPNSNADYIYIFSAIAFFILLLACINFMNLSTARSANRAREIGVRKVLGAYRGQLFRQFLSESILLSVIALDIALIILSLLLPVFNTLSGKAIDISAIYNGPAVMGLIGFALFVGLVAGSYPAVFLSAFKPHDVLKGKLSAGTKSAWLRSGLVVFQFAISIALIAGTLIVGNQLDYMRGKPLGFDKEQVVVIHRASTLGEQRSSFEEQVEQHPDVVSTASTRHVPGVQTDQNAFQLEGSPGTDAYILWTLTVGYDFIETLGIEMAEGRSFSRDFSTDESAYILNKAAAEKLGFENPIGQQLIEPDPAGRRTGQVIGVVKNFHFESLHEDIKPMILRLRPDARFIAVRVRSEGIQETLAFLEQTWQAMTIGQPFEYTFLDEDFENLLRADRKVGDIFTVFSILGILIACLGLFGLASFTMEQRTKEIGVRKVLGASVSTIVMLLSREFVILVGIALILATPAAYFGMNRWLQDFHYRIDIGPDTFLVAGGLALFITLVTVSYQSLKAALANPVNSLRDE